VTTTADQLVKILGISRDEVNALLTTALNEPSQPMLDALLNQFVYLKLTDHESLASHKQTLADLYEQGRHHHLSRQLSKLTRR